MECNDKSHTDDIISNKIINTYTYIKDVIPKVDVESVWKGIRSQILVLQSLRNAEIVFVYSCGSTISEPFRSRMEAFQCNFAADRGDTVTIWLMSSGGEVDVTVL